MEKPIVRKLKNGFTICLVPQKGVQSITAHLRGLAGSNYEKENEIGAAHLVEHLIVEIPSKKEVLQKGGKIVAVTSRDEILIMVKALKKDFRDVLKFLRLAFELTNFDEDSFQIQKKIASQEIKRFMSVPEKLISRLSYKLLFPGQRTESFNTGTEEDLKNLSIENLVSFKKRLYIPNNFCLTISGDFKAQKILDECILAFANFQPGKKVSFNPKKDTKKRIQNIVNPFFTQSHIKIDHYGCKLSSNARINYLIAAKVLDNYLKTLFKTQKGIAYAASVSSYSSINYGVFSTYVAFGHSNLKEVLSTLLNLKKGISTIVTEESFKIAKNELIADLIFSYDKQSTRADFYSQFCVSGMPFHSFAKEISQLKSISFKKCRKQLQSILCQNPKITIFTNKQSSKDLK